MGDLQSNVMTIASDICFAPDEDGVQGEALHCPFVAGTPQLIFGESGRYGVEDDGDLALLASLQPQDDDSFSRNHHIGTSGPVDMEDLASMFIDRFCTVADPSDSALILPLETPPISQSTFTMPLTHSLSTTDSAKNFTSMDIVSATPSHQPVLRVSQTIPVLRKPTVKRAAAKRNRASNLSPGSSPPPTTSPTLIIPVSFSNDGPSSSSAPSSPPSLSPLQENGSLQKKRNCEASARYRKRKQNELETLRQQYLEMYNDNKKQQKRIAALEQENKRQKELLERHNILDDSRFQE